ncbi:MAG: cyclic nucleotide-binding domain-containing protein [Desulfobacterales bacterium]|nr:cyclic nucleotide-binding domain-containing protein [Desulfobacterales bacterium]
MENIDWRELLKCHPFFQGLEDQEIVNFINDEAVREIAFSRGDDIVREGEFAEGIYMVGAGAVKVVLPGRDGRDSVVSSLRKGELFGEMAIFERIPRTATVIAAEDCTLMEIKGWKFMNLLKEHPEIEYRVILKLSERLRRMNKDLLVMNMKDIDKKLDSFNIKLDAELRTVEASLKASQALFDQTKLRAGEVIESADRARARLTVSVTTIATIVSVMVTLFGWFGLSKFMDIKKDAAAIEKRAAMVEQNAATVEEKGKQVQAAAGEVMKKIKEVDALAEKSKEKLSSIDRQIEQFKSLKAIYYNDLVRHFRLKLGQELDAEAAGQYAGIILQTGDPQLTDQIFEALALSLFSNEKENIECSTILLNSLFDERSLKNTRQKLMGAFLLLSSYIIGEESKEDEYEQWRIEYKKIVEKDTDSSIMEDLKEIITLEDDYLFELYGIDEKKVQKLKELIPEKSKSGA